MYEIIKLWIIITFLLIVCTLSVLAEQYPDTSGMRTSTPTKFSFGCGYEHRGVSGKAIDMYTEICHERPLVIFKTAAIVDIFRMQFCRNSLFDFRSIMAEVGTGRVICRPFSLLLRMQYERFSASNSSIFSTISRGSFDIRHFFITTGINFRTLALTGKNIFSPWYTRTESQFTFAIGTRFDFIRPLVFIISINNFDDYATGAFATIGYTAELNLPIYGYDLTTTFGYRPSGTVALAATPDIYVVRLFVRKNL